MKAATVVHDELGCSIRHKVHLMYLYVMMWQMAKIMGVERLGDKLKDWVELFR